MTTEITARVLESPVLRRGIGGAAVAVAWIAGLFAAGPLVGEFGIVVIAEAIIIRSPGWLSTLAIGLLGFYATPVLVAGVVAGIVAATAATAVVWPLRSAPVTQVAVASVLSTVPLLVVSGVEVSDRFIAAVAVAAIPPSVVTHGCVTGFPTADSQRSERRQFLGRIAGIGVGCAAVLVSLRALFGRSPDGQESPRVREQLSGSVSRPAGDPAFDIDGMPDAVTTPEAHYVVDINVNPPVVDPETWTLDIDGAVERSYSLGYDELLEHDERVEQTTTMICISNEVGGDLIGTGHWSGVQLSDLVAAANPTDEAVDVVTYAADGYSEAIPIDLVEREDILVAYGMGERTLATEHGFPARLLIPGRYGMKMTKWIDRIEVATESHEAHWEGRGWDEEAVVNTMSYVRGAERSGDRVTVGGVAFGGLETGVVEIDAVEVSIDDGETWTEAELEKPLAPHAWRRWRYEFDAPHRREFPVVVRAIRRDGTVQTGSETSPRPSGATGWHRTTIRPE
ncbi:MAG: molybdopterin-dependent oxidoreductase [Natronomonas sp.]